MRSSSKRSGGICCCVSESVLRPGGSCVDFRGHLFECVGSETEVQRAVRSILDLYRRENRTEY